MRRVPLLLAAAAAALLAAGCADYGASPGDPNSAVARFAPGGDVNVIQVTVTDRLPARVVELIGPNGTVQPAQTINTDRVSAPRGSYGYGGPSVGLGVGGFGGGGGGFGVGSGIGLSFPLGSSSSETAAVGQVISNAFIPLADPLYYRQTWQSWRVRVQLGDPPGETRVIELNAPAPPA